MTRSQKRCLLASSAAHGLLLVILVAGPAFLLTKPKPVPQTQLQMVDAKLVDNLLSQAAAAKAAATPQEPPPEKTPPPPQPKPPEPKPPEPKKPPPKKTEPKKPEPKKPTRKPELRKPEPRQSLLRPISRDQARKKYAPQRRTEPSRPDPDLVQASRLLERVAEQRTASAATEVQTTGQSAVAMQNYFDYVLGVYKREWQINNNFSGRNGVVKVRVVIRRDGTVTSSSIINPSGDARLDASVRATLDKVKRRGLRPFPAGATDSQRTYKINFNLQGKVSLG